MKCPSCGSRNREGAYFCDSCGAPLEQQPEAAPQARPDRPEDLPETLGGGRYAVERFLGEGGRKRVYLARDLQGDREVAVAVFAVEGMDEALRARARREAQAMRRLGDHPHVVSVYDSGEDDGNPYMVSQYMAGGDVAGLLASEGRLSIERAVAIAEDVCAALEHAHSLGIVHRDIKPANIWLTADGTAKLGDFGLAETGGHSREAERLLVGTVAYLPPEQATGRASDPRSDLYSLGAVLYEMLTAQPPFPGDDALAIISQHLNSTPVAPSRHNPEVPPPLDRAVLRLLAKTADERPESAVAAREELTAALRSCEDPEQRAREEEEAAAADNPLDRLAGGVFVGREREVDELREALDDALGGRGGLLLLVGEPGIGKTRTAEELATYARLQGAKVHWGRCREEGGAPAYWPWVQVIRSYVAEADPVGLAWEMGSAAAEISRIVPEVAEMIGGDGAESSVEAEEDRFRLFDAVTRFLTGAAKGRPLTIILDDLHWADEPSLLLLQFLARELSDSGLLVLATYRDVELGRHHPLAKVLGELAGAGSGRRIALRGLDQEEVARFIEMTAGVGAPDGLAEAVHEQTEGNPFFVSEVVRLLVSEGRLEGAQAGEWELAIPQGVRDVVGRRLDRLSAEANEILGVAAVVGRSFDAEVLARVSAQPEDRVAAGLGEAVAALVVRPFRERFAFSHALVRETLYAELPGPRRGQLHGQIGEVLEERYGSDPGDRIGELAHHFLEATQPRDATKAVDYAIRAAQSAGGRFAHEDAAGYYERALGVLDLEPDADPRRRCELLLELGESQTKAGRFDAARPAFERAAELAKQLDDVVSLGRAALGVSDLSEVGVMDEKLVGLLEDALVAVGPDDSAVRALLLSALAQEYYWEDPQGKAASTNREATEIARRIGDPHALSATLTRERFVTVGPGAARERLGYATEMHDLAKQAGDLELELRAHVYRLMDYLELGDIGAVDRERAAFERLAKELRQPRHLWHVPLLGAMRALLEGRFEDAERLSDEARAGGQRAQEPLSIQFFAIQRALLLRHLGRVEEIITEVKRLADRYPAIRAWRAALAALYGELGRLDEARAAFEPLAASGFADLPRDAQWTSGVSLLSEACARIGDAERAELLYELLAPHSGTAVVTGRGAACYGPVDRYLGLLSATMARTEEAIDHLETALDLATRMGDRPHAAFVRHDLATALLDRGRPDDRERALELFGQALDTAEELGMRLLVERAVTARLKAQGIAGVDVTTSIDSVITAVESERPDIRAYAAADGTVTILFSDIENSTLMTERLGDERWLEVLRRHNTVFRRQVSAHGGAEVKNQGDGFMLVFPSARAGLEAAIAVQREFAAHNADLADDEQMRVRMGLHTGQAIAEEGDFFGRSVILAARIAAQARGGEILVSSSLREQADGDGDGAVDLAFDGGRELELKGLAGTHQVFRAEWEPQATAA
jgi:class 3 adenylate cyclase/tetratricopeptide (TPR) repeat protein